MRGWKITCFAYTTLLGEPWVVSNPFTSSIHLRGEEARLEEFNGSLHQGFDQARFHASVHALMIPTMVTYNAKFEAEYATYPTCHLFHHGYTMQMKPDHPAKRALYANSS